MKKAIYTQFVIVGLSLLVLFYVVFTENPYIEQPTNIDVREAPSLTREAVREDDPEPQEQEPPAEREGRQGANQAGQTQSQQAGGRSERGEAERGGDTEEDLRELQEEIERGTETAYDASGSATAGQDGETQYR